MSFKFVGVYRTGGDEVILKVLCDHLREVLETSLTEVDARGSSPYDPAEIRAPVARQQRDSARTIRVLPRVTR
jgi:hypothetical protein